jgi:hypothetical protein
MWMIDTDLPCCPPGADEAEAEAESDGEEPAARAGDAVEATGGAAQRIEVDEHAQAWLADVDAGVSFALVVPSLDHASSHGPLD